MTLMKIGGNGQHCRSIFYASFPRPDQFKRDSSIALKFRVHDRILSHLDWLLEQYWHGPTDKYEIVMAKKTVILCDLYSTANAWVKALQDGDPTVEKARYPAVIGLFESAARDLSAIFSCRLMEVGLKMAEIFGRTITRRGINTDRKGAIYYSLAERAFYRMHFRGGRAFRYVLESKAPSQLIPIQSSFFYTIAIRNDYMGSLNYAPFVMTLDRTFYMSKHHVKEDNEKGIYHSAYTYGRRVGCAGTMEIKNGTITALRPDSGHYKPKERNIVGALGALAMHGVHLGSISMFNHDGKPAGNALEFLKNGNNWDKLKVQLIPKPKPIADKAPDVKTAYKGNLENYEPIGSSSF